MGKTISGSSCSCFLLPLLLHCHQVPPMLKPDGLFISPKDPGDEWGTKKFSLSWRGKTMTWFPNVQWASWAGAPPHWEKKLLEFTNTHEDGKSIRFELLSALLHSNLCCYGLTIICRNLWEQFCQRLPLAFLSPRSTPGCRDIQGLQHSSLPDIQSREGGHVHQSQFFRQSFIPCCLSLQNCRGTVSSTRTIFVGFAVS